MQKNIVEKIIYGNKFLVLYIAIKGKIFPESNIIKININFRSDFISK
jgi:hypothetical protein